MDHEDQGDNGAPERSDLLPRARAGLWQIPLALAATAVIFALATGAGAMASWLYAAAAKIGDAGAQPAGLRESELTAVLGVFLIVMQAVTIALTLLFAPRTFSFAQPLLPLVWPGRGFRILLLSALAMFTITGASAALVYSLDRSAFVTDIKPFAAMAKTDARWVLFAAAAMGAPLAEELLFRGYLYGVLRATPAGAWGAALVSSLVWSALHMQYSIYGVMLIVLLGLYFAFLRERTGSLVPSLFCHAVYNGGIVLSLMAAPENAFA